MLFIPAERVRRQSFNILRAWGQSEAHANITADILTETDLRGIDSHGLSMLPVYFEQLATKLNMTPNIRVVRETQVSALIDADSGLGHVPGHMGMTMAIDKAKSIGVGIVTVRNSAHYGAAGFYTDMAARAGLIGISTTSSRGLAMVPTFGAEPVFGTNPISVAAPAKRNAPFNLDMATTTVAVGKLKLKWLNDKPLPVGWALDEDGKPLTDARRAFELKNITPLGGTRELGSHKGYGLAAVVNLLAATLSGAAFQPLRLRREDPKGPDNIGHFFLAFDPKLFRDEGEFEHDMDEMLDYLRTVTPVDPQQPVLAPGDPEYQQKVERAANGIPVPEKLDELVRKVCHESKADYVLTVG
ncbi:MAG: Ldh family oxidoreductase [Proteobacteria bacterium]|nr:Ldh family oxidoreductase [Burkholderiales bacterium]